MTTPETSRGQVRLYACGGGGINIGHLFERHRGVEEAGFAKVDTVYLDTSRSNMRTSMPGEHTYLIDGLDGSGKLRRENHVVIAERVRDMLHSHEPRDLNVVLSTGAGGSGSVIAPSLVSELLSMDLPTVVVLVGSAESKLDVDNTLKTIKSYEAVAKLRQAPVVVAYFENCAETPRGKVDAAAESVITSLCGLFSRQNREMDSKDLYNFLRFERVTSFQPGVVGLSICDQQSDLSALGNVISVATLAKVPDEAAFAQMPEYRTVGFVAETASPGIISRMPLHYVTSDGILPAVVQRLNDTLQQLNASQKQRLRAGPVLSTSDNATDNGLVL